MEAPKSLSPPLPTKLIHQFPIPTWIENLAIRANGTILVTLLTTPDLYLIDPTTSSPKLIHAFPPMLALTGIIETTPEMFYIAAGNFNVSTNSSEQGSYEVWEVDLTSLESNESVKTTKICAIKESGLLNGMELLSASKGEILIADSEIGCVWKVLTKTGKYEKIIAIPEMMPPEPPGLPMGINGLKIRDGFLYWTNTGLRTFSRVMVDEVGKVVGEVEVLVEDLLVDDFVFDGEGRAWMATNPMNTVAVVGGSAGVSKESAGKYVVVVAGKGDDLTVAGGTACQFGRGEADKHILYLVTTGGLAAPVNGEIEGGKLVGIDTSGFTE